MPTPSPLSGPFIDISVALSPELPVWPGDPPIQVEPAARISEGASANVSRLALGTHTGTHLDPPYHFINDGARVDALPFEPMIGPCWLSDLTWVKNHITADDLERMYLRRGIKRLLLRTPNSQLWSRQPHEFDTGFIGLAPSAARWIVDRGIQLVGIDYFSVEPYGGDGETHRILLGAGVVALEALDLRDVNIGAHTLICLPLKIAGGDGAPCRALLGPPSLDE